MKSPAREISLHELSHQNNTLPVEGALFELTIGTMKLMQSQDQSAEDFFAAINEISDNNEKLELIVGVLEGLEGKLVDFDPTPAGLD